MKSLKDRVNFYLKKIDLLNTPFIGQISDCIESSGKFEKTTELVLIGTHENRTGEFNLRINSVDEVYLANMFGVDWSRLNKDEIFAVSAFDSGDKFKGFPVYKLVVKVWQK